MTTENTKEAPTSATPRTDAELKEDWMPVDDYTKAVSADFARTLERELADANNKRTILSAALDRMVAQYESEQEFPEGSSFNEFRPEWLKVALGIAYNAEGH